MSDWKHVSLILVRHARFIIYLLHVHSQGANTSIVRATAFCDKRGWYRFYNPLQSSRYILSIQNGTDTEPLENVIDFVEIQTVPALVRTDNGS